MVLSMITALFLRGFGENALHERDTMDEGGAGLKFTV